MKYLLALIGCGLAAAAAWADYYVVGGRDAAVKAPFSAC